MNTLVNNCGIEVSRLTPESVGPLSPVLTNMLDDGIKLIRRVKLAEK